MGTRRVAIDPEAYAVALELGSRSGDELEIAGRRILDCCEAVQVAGAPGLRVHHIGRALNTRVVAMRPVLRAAGRGGVTTAVPARLAVAPCVQPLGRTPGPAAPQTAHAPHAASRRRRTQG